MAGNLLRAGFRIGVHDVRPEAGDRFRRLGARTAATPAELAASCDVLTVTVVDEQQVRDVLCGAGGAFEALRPGCVVIIHSTISPAACESIAADAEPLGVQVLDAAISGGQAAADAGELTLMVGGSEEAAARCSAVFDAISAQRFHVGPIGSGQAAKVINNVMGLVNRIVAGEAIRLAGRTGVNLQTVLEIVTASTGDSWQVRHWEAVTRMAAGSTTGADGMGRMAEKDLRLALDLAALLHVDMPVTAIAIENAAGMFRDPVNS
jgi:3-hydroxyisobutyrate dehydrogenase